MNAISHTEKHRNFINAEHGSDKQIIAYNMSLPRRVRLNRMQLIEKYGLTEWAIRIAKQDPRTYELRDKMVHDALDNLLPDILAEQAKHAANGNLQSARFVWEVYREMLSSRNKSDKSVERTVTEKELCDFVSRFRTTHKTTQNS